MRRSEGSDLQSTVPQLRAYLGTFTGNLERGDSILLSIFEEIEREGQGRPNPIDLFQRAHKHAISPRQEQPEVVVGMFALTATPPPAEVSLDWNMAPFRAAFAKLSVNHREVLFLVEVAHLTYKEAAGVCGCAIGTIRSRLARARAKIYAHLDPIGEW